MPFLPSETRKVYLFILNKVYKDSLRVLRFGSPPIMNALSFVNVKKKEVEGSVPPFK